MFVHRKITKFEYTYKIAVLVMKSFWCMNRNLLTVIIFRSDQRLRQKAPQFSLKVYPSDAAVVYWNATRRPGVRSQVGMVLKSNFTSFAWDTGFVQETRHKNQELFKDFPAPNHFFPGPFVFNSKR